MTDHPSNSPPPPQPDQVELLAREAVYSGYLHVSRLRLRHAQYAGGMGPPLTREVVERGHAVALLPYDPWRDCVVLIEQFRPGPWLAGEPAWMQEVVAGIVEPGEDPETVARRECAEECGLTPDRLEPVGRFFLSPGILTETVTLFCGRVEAGAAGGFHGLAAEGEDIRAVAIPAADFAALGRSGRMTNATALIAAQWFALNHASLRAAWTLA